MNKQAIQWLYGELPKLVEQGVLSDDVAARLRARYGVVEPNRPGRLFVTGCVTRKRLFATSGAMRGRLRRISGTGSIHTVCHMPVVRV